jgi:hypothetical protein
MPDTPHLRPATPDEIADALSFALRYQGRKRVHHADDMMAQITAERLIQHLTASGFVVMKGQRPTCRPPEVETSVCWPATGETNPLRPPASHCPLSVGRSPSSSASRSQMNFPRFVLPK